MFSAKLNLLHLELLYSFRASGEDAALSIARAQLSVGKKLRTFAHPITANSALFSFEKKSSAL